LLLFNHKKNVNIFKNVFRVTVTMTRRKMRSNISRLAEPANTRHFKMHTCVQPKHLNIGRVWW